MCLESVAHLLVMINSSSNFLIYCSVSTQFKTALAKHYVQFCGRFRNREKLRNENVPVQDIDIDKVTFRVKEIDHESGDDDVEI